ncbi:hypothetical protein [Sphingomonas corticis]|uniref:Uncharacterized protein n=1 Tax=Sphingomonas corticis TaxID=2722791 RepID=A0ABX1CMM4_9SPHN|nr:hypothetical protein [Sphingomonas corticis]NJR79212.1 hypothetical protein [Sphingomonas corticis]
MADEPFDDSEPVRPEAKKPMMIGIGYLALLLLIGLGVLLVAGGLIRL